MHSAAFPEQDGRSSLGNLRKCCSAVHWDCRPSFL
uniref:Uncharacterized protein n=1 Tax=Arundo donax TaxID=35708 RepID=A0A0A9EMT8_ARUDO